MIVDDDFDVSTAPANLFNLPHVHLTGKRGEDDFDENFLDIIEHPPVDMPDNVLEVYRPVYAFIANYVVGLYGGKNEVRKWLH